MRYYCKICAQFSVEEVNDAKFAVIGQRFVCRRCGRAYSYGDNITEIKRDCITELPGSGIAVQNPVISEAEPDCMKEDV